MIVQNENYSNFKHRNSETEVKNRNSNAFSLKIFHLGTRRESLS